MPFIDYRELSPTNRHIRIRRIEALKAIVRANCYDIGPRDIADGIISDALKDYDRHRRTCGS